MEGTPSWEGLPENCGVCTEDADNKYLVTQRTLGVFQVVNVPHYMQRPGNTRAHRKKLIVAAARLGEGTLGEGKL